MPSIVTMVSNEGDKVVSAFGNRLVVYQNSVAAST